MYILVSSDPDLPIYKIKPENGSKPMWTVHSNLLFKCNKLPFETSSPFSKLKVLSSQKPSNSAEFQTKSESASESEFILNPQDPKANYHLIQQEEYRKEE